MKNGYRIVVVGLSHSYAADTGEQAVLSDVSFVIEPGRVLSVLGANGSGKTTVLSSVAGLITPRGGTVAIQSAHADGQSVAPTVAYLHQDYRQTNFPWASALENVTYPLMFRGVSAHDRRARGAEALSQFLPEVDPERRAYELSGGQQQLLAIARALVSGPDVLLGDEPLSAADSIRGMRAIQAIEQVWQANKFPMMWVSHDIDEALLLGDSIGLLSRRKRGFDAFIDNPVSRPRRPADLARPEMAHFKAEILEFLLSDNIT